jgi:hypothetical protein
MRISSKLKGMTKQFGCLQAAARERVLALGTVLHYTGMYWTAFIMARLGRAHRIPKE